MPEDQKKIDEAATDAAAGAKAAEGETAGAPPAAKKPDDNVAFFQQLIDLLMPMMPGGFGQALKAFSSLIGGTFGQETEAKPSAEGQDELPEDEQAKTEAAPETAPISLEPGVDTPEEEKTAPSVTDAPDAPVMTQEEKADLVFNALLKKFDTGKDGSINMLEALAMQTSRKDGGGLPDELEGKITNLLGQSLSDKTSPGVLDKAEFRNIAKQLDGDIDAIVDQLTQKGVLSQEDAAKIASSSATDAGTGQNAADWRTAGS